MITKQRGNGGRLIKKNDKAMPEWGKRKRPIYPEEPDKGATGLTLEHHCEWIVYVIIFSFLNKDEIKINKTGFFSNTFNCFVIMISIPVVGRKGGGDKLNAVYLQ